MRWLIMPLLSLCSVLTLLPVITTPIEQISSSTWTDFLRLRDCELPCWISIEPGQTSLGTAKTQVASAYGGSVYDINEWENHFVITNLATGHQVRVAFVTTDGNSTNEAIVQRIFLEPTVISGADSERPTIADLQGLLGNPEMVRLSTGIETSTLAVMYQDQQVHIFVDDLDGDKVLPNQTVLSIVLQDDTNPDAAWLSVPQNWVGYDHCYNFERTLP